MLYSCECILIRTSPSEELDANINVSLATSTCMYYLPQSMEAPIAPAATHLRALREDLFVVAGTKLIPARMLKPSMCRRQKLYRNRGDVCESRSHPIGCRKSAPRREESQCQQMICGREFRYDGRCSAVMLSTQYSAFESMRNRVFSPQATHQRFLYDESA